MLRFNDAELQALHIDPTRGLWTDCPFCGGTLVYGHRADTGNLCLAHSAFTLPDGQAVCGCDPFRGLVYQDPRELFRLLRSSRCLWRHIAG